MAELIRSATRSRKTLARAVAIAGLAAASVTVAAPTALASGTSPTTYGCYSSWGNTGSNGHCQSVGRTGDFQNEIDCSFSGDSSIWYLFHKGNSKPNWGYVECNFSANRSWINYKIDS
ncbi:hypothetical protein FB563_2966 [Streptomyces puniciscabiei]|uniref:Peptidase inhibitor family I36 n=1 Tax=Streptomyces puniciscabiei TaxID=164348 RepID=A0A542UFY0_9ACTN|nr:hypothetical protein [Streptomyces puniciscabiei]TQK97969.1 hypothetical protein FB563_2966 [Streptomyces puniciscabiei]